MDMKLETAVYRASRAFLERHRVEELELFEVFWAAARAHLVDLAKADPRSPGWLSGIGGIAEPTADAISPKILMVFAIIFTECPLDSSKRRKENQVREVVGKAADRVGLAACGESQQRT